MSTQPAATAVKPSPPSCKNCSAPLAGAYCSACGQESRIETPTVGEFVREFVQEQMALEGKLLRTLKLLVTQPGALTLDYIQGRRQCYVRPLRLYLALSVVFFGVVGLFGHPDDLIHLGQVTRDTSQAASPAGAAASAKAAPQAEPDSYLFYTDDSSKLRNLKTGNASLDAQINRFFSQDTRQINAQLGKALINDAPLATFFLLPLFAGMLQLAYLRHHLRYGVHLLFSLHFHAFVFLDLLVQKLPWPSIVDGLLNFVIPAYLVLALRRVYGGRAWTTALGVAVMTVVYSILIGLTLFAAAMISSIISS